MIEYISNDIGEKLIDSGYTAEGWYFWDELQLYCYGPYETIEETRLKEKEYAERL